MSDKTRRLYGICAEAVGIPADEFMRSREWRARVSVDLFAIIYVDKAVAWPRAKQSAEGLHKVLATVRKLRAEIEALNGEAWSLLTGMADPDVPPGKEYDPLAPLAELEARAEQVAGQAAGTAAWRPNGAGGRTPNRRAYAVAAQVAALYQNLTGEAPGFYTGDPTPYERMLQAFFREQGIKANTQRPALWAIAELKRKAGN